LNQASNLDCSRRSAATVLVHPRQTCPEPARPLALPADDSVGSDVYQGSAPAIPQQGEPDPEQSVEGSQNGSFPFSLKGGELKAESGVLHRHGRVTAEKKSREAKHEQDEGWHEPRFLVFIVIKVRLLRTDGILANHWWAEGV
jgi:hypothetical protein